MAKPVSAYVRFKTLCLRADAMFVRLQSAQGHEFMLPMQRSGRAIWVLEIALPLGNYQYHYCRRIDGRIVYHRPGDARIPVTGKQAARLEVTGHGRYAGPSGTTHSSSTGRP